MNDTMLTAPPTAIADRPSVGRAATAAVGLSIASLVVLLIRNTNDGPVWRVSLIVGALIAVLTAIVFGVVVCRVLAKRSAQSSTRAALVLGVLAVLSIVAFWLAVPPIFGIAAVVLVLDARDRRPFPHEWTATLAGVLGVLGTVAGLALSCTG
jgi:F0F1-type ATP synthase assembly protein I